MAREDCGPTEPMSSSAVRAQSLGEEVANAVSHGAGFLLAVASLPVLVSRAMAHGDAAAVVGASLFSATMIVLYLVSALYHALPPGAAKRWFNRLDHAAIYLFIAGSYMPYLLGVLRGAWGWTLFGIVWGTAAFGVSAKLFNRLRHPLWSTGLYLAMGWVAVIAAAPLLERLPLQNLAWLVAGGLSYTLGAVVFLLDSKIRYAHFVWHLFVMAGSACHVLAAVVRAA
jgi:hemolysin III